MAEEIEKQILELFTKNEKLKFSEIESSIKIRSNKLAYYIKQLLNKGILSKTQEYYSLSETTETLIPYLSNKNSPLVVILIRIGNSKECLLYKRLKRPFKDKLSLPGGRLLANETISEAVTRIMKEKHNINARLEKINSVNIEYVKRNNKELHSFLLILVSAKTKDKINLANILTNKKNIIKSDYQLITSKNTEVKIKEFITSAD